MHEYDIPCLGGGKQLTITPGFIRHDNLAVKHTKFCALAVRAPSFYVGRPDKSIWTGGRVV